MTSERIDNMTVEEVQEALGVSRATVSMIAKNGDYLGIPVRSRRIRVKLFFARADIERVKAILERKNLFEE